LGYKRFSFCSFHPNKFSTNKLIIYTIKFSTEIHIIFLKTNRLSSHSFFLKSLMKSQNGITWAWDCRLNETTTYDGVALDRKEGNEWCGKEREGE